jgi:signal transduction histidine kinase
MAIMDEDSRAARLRMRLAPVLRLARRVDLTAAMVVLAVIAAITLASIETPTAVGRYGLPLVVGFGLALVHAGSLPLAVVRPVLASGLAVAASLILQVLGGHQPSGPWPWWPVLLVTHSLLVFIVGLRTRWPLAVGGWAAAVVTSTAAVVASHPQETEPASQNLVVFVSVAGGALVLAIVLGQWREIRDQLLREREVSAEAYSRRLLAEDRARIARELHDVVAHSMSIINIQASTARYRIPALDEHAIGEFEEIATSSRQALSEMRTLLGVLRADDVAGDLAPQPGLDDIPELVAQAQRAGLRVNLTSVDSGEATEVTEVVALTAYRVVQEALTNAVRHAASSTVTVGCAVEGGFLRLDIRNTAVISVRATSGTRLGLIGMAERAASVGGTLEAGKTPDGGFAVRAALPVRGAGTGGAR